MTQLLLSHSTLPTPFPAQPSLAPLPAADEDGDTPLHNAARGNHAEVVQFLLSLGADPRARNSEGHTPAQEADEEPVIELLKQAITNLLKVAEAAA